MCKGTEDELNFQCDDLKREKKKDGVLFKQMRDLKKNCLMGSRMQK